MTGEVISKKKNKQKEDYKNKMKVIKVTPMSNCACNNWLTQGKLIDIINLKKAELINN